MHLLTSTGLLLAALAGQAAPENPCTNGSFEQLAPNGFPADWSPVGTTVEVSSDAHSGERSLRLLRTAETEPAETGLNRGWRPDTGRRGAMLEELKGGIDFWYKAVSAKSAQLNIYVIPMTEEPIERTGAPRATYTVPEGHIGDGRWHHARLKYDFTDNPKAKWVHFAARIVGTAGELLLDDLSYVEQVGPVLRFGKIRIDEDPERPGRRCTVRTQVENAGDAAALGVRATMVVSLAGDAASEVTVGNLAPDQKLPAVWTFDGERAEPCRLELRASSGDVATEASLALVPQLVLKSFGPRSPLAAEGRPFPVDCLLKNTGHVILREVAAEFIATRSELTKDTPELAPGRSVVLTASLGPARQTEQLELAVRATAENFAEALQAESQVVVGAGGGLPEPSGTLSARVTDDLALLENEHVRLAFRRNAFGFGPGELSAATASGWQTVAWLPRLARLVVEDAEGKRRDQAVAATKTPEARTDAPARLVFEWEAPPSEPGACRIRVGFELAPGEKSIAADHQLSSTEPCKLLAFDGPMVYAVERDEAVFPGLEWLVDDEVSSSTLDIAEGHAHQVRYVVHPNMVTIPAVGIHGRHGTVGLVWDVHQKWDGQRDRPSVAFASPDRFGNQRTHLVGLFLPTVPEFVPPNAREATEPYPLEPDKPIRLRARIFADGTAADALAAVDEWACLYGCPKPAPLPHGSYDREIEFSMQAYLKSLWEAETKDWWTTKGGGMMSNQARPRSFVADLLLGEILTPGEAVRRACRARADEVLALIGGEARVDAQRFSARADLQMANPGAAAALLASRGDDGAWRFDADQQHTSGPFVGMDYHELGPDDAVEVGTCARRAFEVLRYARIAGDPAAYEQMRNTLELMERFRVPRAAQVWEVPVHTPDVLAAADAVDAYVEAYRFSGDQRWLRNAVTWARRGLPFIYLWDDPDKPFLVGGSIPVFGATWYQGSWFGRPVQWNGLRYANALLKLVEYDQSYPWRKIAEAIIRSAIHQQDLDGENVALWPDNISALDCEKCPWVFAPRQIIRNVLKLTGRDEDPATVILGEGKRRLHVSATGKISQATWEGGKLGFRVTYPPGEQGVVLVSNVTRPKAVLLDGAALAEREEVEQGPESGWRYDAANAYLSVRVPREGESAVEVQGAEFVPVQRLPWLAKGIAFEFDESVEGWMAAHHIASMTVEGGVLEGKISGGDPYLIRTLVRAEGDDYPVIRLRMRVSAGQGGQLFWTTESSPGFAEDKTVRFGIQADGQFHEYRLEPGQDPMWSGQTITGLRIDPGNGAPSAEFAIDYLRGGKE